MNDLEKKFGGRWFGISVFGLPVKCKDEFFCPPTNNVCDGLKAANTGKVLLRPCDFSCPGARYAFGCGGDSRDLVVKQLVQKHDLSPERADEVVEQIPHCLVPTGAVGIGLRDDPNLWLARLQPAQMMRVVREYETKLRQTFHPEISSAVVICGGVIVGALQKQDMTIGFGCDDVRDNGCLSRDRLLVAIPSSLAVELAR